MEEDMKEEGMQINILMQKYIVCLHILPGKKKEYVCGAFCFLWGKKEVNNSMGRWQFFPHFSSKF